MMVCINFISSIPQIFSMMIYMSQNSSTLVSYLLKYMFVFSEDGLHKSYFVDPCIIGVYDMFVLLVFGDALHKPYFEDPCIIVI